MELYTAGIDFGSLSGRCVLINLRTGKEEASSVYEYPHAVMDKALPDGTPLQIDWCLQHPRDYKEVLQHTIRNCMKQIGIDNSQIVGIGTDFTSCTMLPILEDGTPLCMLDKYQAEPHAYVKLWKHHAAQPEAEELNRIAHERGEKFINRYGGKISSEWMFPKIWQILNESPEVYEDTYCFLEATDWIVQLLTGKIMRNSCSAGYKAIWHKKEGYPSKEFFRALDVRLENVIEDKMKGPVVPIGTKAGVISKEAAELTGLKEGTAVSVSHLDAAGATVGAGVTSAGQMLIMMGTSSCHMLLGDKEREVPGMCGLVEDGIIPGYIGYEAGQSCVGDHFQWAVENITPAEYYEAAQESGQNIHEYLSALAELKEPGESGVLALDWWNGNRSVLVDGKLSGMLIGCTLQTKTEDIYRALIEATAFGTRKIVETFEQNDVPVNEIIIAGGIAQKNPFAMQVYADITGKEIKVAGSKQNAALSSAIWAALAAGNENGGFDTLEEAVDRLSNVQSVKYTPNQEHKEVYDELYTEYEKLHDYFGRGENNVMKRLKKITENIKEKKMQR